MRDGLHISRMRLCGQLLYAESATQVRDERILLTTVRQDPERYWENMRVSTVSELPATAVPAQHRKFVFVHRLRS